MMGTAEGRRLYGRLLIECFLMAFEGNIKSLAGVGVVLVETYGAPIAVYVSEDAEPFVSIEKGTKGPHGGEPDCVIHVESPRLSGRSTCGAR